MPDPPVPPPLRPFLERALEVLRHARPRFAAEVASSASSAGREAAQLALREGRLTEIDEAISELEELLS